METKPVKRKWRLVKLDAYILSDVDRYVARALLDNGKIIFAVHSALEDWSITLAMFGEYGVTERLEYAVNDLYERVKRDFDVEIL